MGEERRTSSGETDQSKTLECVLVILTVLGLVGSKVDSSCGLGIWLIKCSFAVGLMEGQLDM
jgi:hypothetical protein